MVRGVLLDFYGTLAHATSWGPRFEDVLATHGLTWSPEHRVTAAALDGADHVAHSVDRDTYVAWERSRLELLAVASGAGEDVVTRVVDDLYGASKTWEMAPYDEVVAVLAALRDRGVRIVICSNWDWDLDEVVDRLDLRASVDVVVTSARAGFRKPHPGIYAHTLELAGLGAGEVVFAGDSWEPDVAGPLRAGIPAALHVHRDDDPAPPPDLLPGAHRAPDLTALLDLV